MLGYFDMHWDLSQNNEFDGTKPVNKDSRGEEYGRDTYMYSTDTARPVIPTSGGWVHPYYADAGAYIRSGDFSYEGLHQFSMMFEVFPVSPTFNFYFYPYEASSPPFRLTIQFNVYYTYIFNPSMWSTSVRLTPQVWNRVRR